MSEILQVINSLDGGGAEKVVETLMKKLDLPVFVLTEREHSKKTPNVYIGTKSKYYKFNPFVFFRLLNTVKKNKIKILHVHLAFSIFYSLILKMFKKNIRIIYHEHGEINYNRKLFFLLKIFSKKIDLFIAVSKYNANFLKSNLNLNKDKVKIFHNFVDLQKFNFSENEKSNKGFFTIGYVGRLTEVKGCKYLIKSLKYLDINYKCLIVGEGKLKNTLIQLAIDEDVYKNVEFLGYRKEIYKIYKIFDVLVIPSLSEASPLNFFEAQACGLPVIASNIPQIKEYIIFKKNGLSFKTKNPKSLANKINLIAKNKKLLKIMSLNSKNDIKKYSCEKYLENIKLLYEDLK